MIAPGQVADLRAGDVVEIADASGVSVRGRLRHSGLRESQGLSLGASGIVVRRVDGCLAGRWADNAWHLTVVSRAPLYVNHPRAEPVPGDVVRDADSNSPETWVRNVRGCSYEWLSSIRHEYVPPGKLPARLRLLVDGETGQVVP